MLVAEGTDAFGKNSRIAKKANKSYHVTAHPKREKMSKQIVDRWLKPTVLIPLLLLLPSLHAEIFRCTQAGGKMAYQNTACDSGDQRAIRAPSVTPVNESSTVQDYKRQAARLAEREHVRDAISRREALVGMTRDELRDALGNPARSNSSVSASSTMDQLIFERPGRIIYVYTQNNIVTRIDTGARSAPLVIPCPDERARRKLDIDASNYYLRGNAEAQQNIRDRQAEVARCKR
ncbi:hypothetical protein [Massilia sp. TSP1-1-2]|uniref:hypothetical protein n=1 Tax=Massilia sp. TSP1-1-2 TaxID=2804649 RepID=UPI003CF79918